MPAKSSGERARMRSTSSKTARRWARIARRAAGDVAGEHGVEDLHVLVGERGRRGGLQPQPAGAVEVALRRHHSGPRAAVPGQAQQCVVERLVEREELLDVQVGAPLLGEVLAQLAHQVGVEHLGQVLE